MKIGPFEYFKMYPGTEQEPALHRFVWFTDPNELTFALAFCKAWVWPHVHFLKGNDKIPEAITLQNFYPSLKRKAEWEKKLNA